MAGEDLSWIPTHCTGGHELGPGRVSLSWVHCDCPRSAPVGGHHVAFCRECYAKALPPRCGGVKPQR